MNILNFSKIFKNQSIIHEDKISLINQKYKYLRYKPFLFLFFVISLGMFYAFSVDKQLYADGIHYFILMLKDKTFTSQAPSRLLANIINEWPMVLGLNLGIKDINILSWLFALGAYFPFIFALGISLYATRDQNKDILLFFITGILCINIPTDFIIVGEHQVLTLLTWPIFFILIRDKTLSNLDGIILIFLLILFADLYETSVVISSIFLFVSLIRWFYFKGKKQRLIMTIGIIISIFSIMYNAYYILNPRDIKNVNFFLNGISYSLVNIQFVFPAFFVFIFTLNLVLRSKFLFIVNIATLLIYLIVTLVFGYSPSPVISFGSRTLTASFLPFLLLYTFIFKRLKLFLNPQKMIIFTLFVLVIISGNIYNSYKWSTYRSSVVNILQNNNGIVNIKNTFLKNSKYNWGWNITELSLVWSYDNVKSVLIDKGSSASWKAYNPLKPYFLDEYFHYNKNFIKSEDTFQVEHLITAK